jgi:hypothetical protein
MPSELQLFAPGETVNKNKREYYKSYRESYNILPDQRLKLCRAANQKKQTH